MTLNEHLSATAWMAGMKPAMTSLLELGPSRLGALRRAPQDEVLLELSRLILRGPSINFRCP